MSRSQTILVLGADRGGLRCAILLGKYARTRSGIKVVLIDESPDLLLKSELYRLATSQSGAKSNPLTLDSLSHRGNFKFIEDSVRSFNLVSKSIVLEGGGKVTYDFLVLSSVNQTAKRIPGLLEYGYFLDSFRDAFRLRQAIKLLTKRQKSAKVVICGGDLYGVEAASILSLYPVKTDLDQVEVSLVEQNSHLLSGFSRSFSEEVQTQLEKYGVKVYTSQSVKLVKPDSVVMSSGISLGQDFLIWTGRRQRTSSGKSPLGVHNSRGHLRVNANWQLSGYSNVYVLDNGSAHLSNLVRSLPYFASELGAHIAKNVIRQLNKDYPRPYELLDRPILVKVGETTYCYFKHRFYRSRFFNVVVRLNTFLYYCSVLSIWQAILLV